MATGPMNQVILRLRNNALVLNRDALSDGQLLGAFIEHGDEAAFAAIVQRHGPMVWGVCRRMLGHHDAEDAFQAAFLVLFRKAGSIAPRQMLANWLYGVAHHAALHARRTLSRRSNREKQVSAMPELKAAVPDGWTDLQPVLDEELSRLPDKYRSVIVVCDLEGKTRQEAAHRLARPEGTIAGWLARARVMLAKRLTRRGIALSGGALAVMMSQQAASASAPVALTSATLKAAGLLAAGQTGVISVNVAALTEGVLKTMLINKLKIASVIVAFAAFCGTAGFLYHTQAGEPSNVQQVLQEPPRIDQEERQRREEQARAEAELERAAVQLEVAKANYELAKANLERLSAKANTIDRLQGTWHLVMTQVEGLGIGEGRPEIKDSRLVIEKNAFTMYSKLFHSPNVPLPSEDVKVTGTLALHDGKEITLTWENDPWSKKKNVARRGIYKLEGDTLRICFSTDENAKAAPTQFNAPYGSKLTILTFKAAAKAK